ncbi:MAG: helix-turn-helix domain-containing protein, partial [Candidatus Nitrotoga sp.]
MNSEPWVTAIDVARHLGVVKDTVYRWRERKGLPAHKIGRLWKFQLSEVDEWVRTGGADEGTAQADPIAAHRGSGG